MVDMVLYRYYRRVKLDSAKVFSCKEMIDLGKLKDFHQFCLNWVSYMSYYMRINLPRPTCIKLQKGSYQTARKRDLHKKCNFRNCILGLVYLPYKGQRSTVKLFDMDFGRLWQT